MTLRNAFADLATEEGQDALLNHMINERIRVGTSRTRLRDDFLTFDTDTVWRLLQTGTGQTLSLGGVSNASRYLNINTGTQIGETIFLSRETFKTPVKFAFGTSISQRIAGQEFYVELVEVDSNGNVVEDTTVFTAPTVNNAKNAIGVLYDGTSTTSSKYVARVEGLSEYTPTLTSFGTSHSVATGTSPNFNAAFQTEILLQTELFNIVTRAVNSAGSETATPANRTDLVPNPNVTYAIRVRIKNTSVPASATDFRLHFVRIIDASRVSVDFGMIGGSGSAMLAAPVRVITSAGLSATVVTNPTITTESATNLAANAVYTGASRDLGSTNSSRYICVYAFANQPGVLRVDFSTDGSTWRRATTDLAVATDTPVMVQLNVMTRYYRVVYTNGPTAQTAFLLTSAVHRV